MIERRKQGDGPVPPPPVYYLYIFARGGHRLLYRAYTTHDEAECIAHQRRKEQMRLEARREGPSAAGAVQGGKGTKPLDADHASHRQQEAHWVQKKTSESIFVGVAVKPPSFYRDGVEDGTSDANGADGNAHALGPSMAFLNESICKPLASSEGSGACPRVMKDKYTEELDREGKVMYGLLCTLQDWTARQSLLSETEHALDTVRGEYAKRRGMPVMREDEAGGTGEDSGDGSGRSTAKEPLTVDESVALGHGFVFESIESDTFHLHFMEVPTGVKFVVAAAPSTPARKVKRLMKHLYTHIYVKLIVRNPFMAVTRDASHVGVVQKLVDHLVLRLVPPPPAAPLQKI